MPYLAGLIIALLAVPVAGALLAAATNRRAGELDQARTLCGGGLAWAVLLSLLDAVWCVLLVLVLYPFGRRAPEPLRPYRGTPVLLAHGLYNTTSVWTLFRRRLARAGLRETRAFGYASFGASFPDIAAALAREIAATAAASPSGRVLLVGHSLGGLLLRAACADPEVCSLVAGVVTLACPHRGSTLAARFAVGGLGRGLGPGGGALRHLEGLGQCAAPSLSLFTPVDGMVQPLSGSLITEEQRLAGWREECVGRLSHVGMLFHSRTAERAARFFEDCLAASPKGPEAP